MFRTQLNAVASSARRVLPSLGLGVALLASVLGPPAPTATAAPPPEPAAQLQVVVKEVKVHDDREGTFSGEGEMRLFVGIWRCKQGVPLPCVGSYIEGQPERMDTSFPNTAGPIARSGALFNAGTGETVTLDRPVPQRGDVMWGGNTSEERGFAVYAGERYVMQFDMDEWDAAEPFGTDEYMGYAFHFLGTGELSLGIGTHTARSLKNGGRS